MQGQNGPLLWLCYSMTISKKKNQVTQKWQAVSGSTNYVPLLMSTTNANFQDSFLSGILPVKNQECNLCPILMSAYYWCQWNALLHEHERFCLYSLKFACTRFKDWVHFDFCIPWALQVVNFSLLLIKCIIGSFHQKRRNDIFRSTVCWKSWYNEHNTTVFLWLLYTWREIYTGVHWLRCNFQRMFIIRRYQSAFWQVSTPGLHRWSVAQRPFSSQGEGLPTLATRVVHFMQIHVTRVPVRIGRLSPRPPSFRKSPLHVRWVEQGTSTWVEVLVETGERKMIID